jgi:hypothetical protein
MRLNAHTLKEPTNMATEEQSKLVFRVQAAVPEAAWHLCIAAVEKFPVYEDALAVVQYFTPGHPNYNTRPKCLGEYKEAT